MAEKDGPAKKKGCKEDSPQGPSEESDNLTSGGKVPHSPKSTQIYDIAIGGIELPSVKCPDTARDGASLSNVSSKEKTSSTAEKSNPTAEKGSSREKDELAGLLERLSVDDRKDVAPLFGALRKFPLVGALRKFPPVGIPRKYFFERPSDEWDGSPVRAHNPPAVSASRIKPYPGYQSRWVEDFEQVSTEATWPLSESEMRTILDKSSGVMSDFSEWQERFNRLSKVAPIKFEEFITMFGHPRMGPCAFNKREPFTRKDQAKAGLLVEGGQLKQDEKKIHQPIFVPLKDKTVDGIIDYVKSGHPKCIITMAGAGISTGAGIPDFRSPGSGLYHNLAKYNLPYSQAIFEYDYFTRDPEPFFALAKELIPRIDVLPTKAHYFIKLLEVKGLLLRHYTQNIDNLERVAEISNDLLVEAHGSFHTSRCLNCMKVHTYEEVREKILREIVPVCSYCKGLVKPNIVFFGEPLPARFFQLSEVDFKQCDLLIIMGSSLAVEPFASLCRSVHPKCPRLLVNREKAGVSVGLSYGRDSNERDVAWLGDCDKFVDYFCSKLGWSETLKQLMADGKSALKKKVKRNRIRMLD